jgi:hypothetical protein
MLIAGDASPRSSRSRTRRSPCGNSVYHRSHAASGRSHTGSVQDLILRRNFLCRTFPRRIRACGAEPRGRACGAPGADGPRRPRPRPDAGVTGGHLRLAPLAGASRDLPGTHTHTSVLAHQLHQACKLAPHGHGHDLTRTGYAGGSRRRRRRGTPRISRRSRNRAPVALAGGDSSPFLEAINGSHGTSLETYHQVRHDARTDRSRHSSCDQVSLSRLSMYTLARSISASILPRKLRRRIGSTSHRPACRQNSR